jgi:hypothetical protein
VAARFLGLRVGIPPGACLTVCLSVVSVVCCQAEVSASGWSLVQRSPTDCGVSEGDREASTKRRPWPTGGLSSHERKKLYGSTEENHKTVQAHAMAQKVSFSYTGGLGLIRGQSV